MAQEAPHTVILAEDEASLYLQATTAAVFAPVGQTPVVPVAAQRDKVCFYGTLNLMTGQEVAQRSVVMNATTTVQHLQQVLDTYPDVAILMLIDRAPWHRGEPVRRLLEENPRLEILYLPVAAPDLNPQEHVWKATRRATSHNHSLKRLPDLADRFEAYLTSNAFPSSLLDTYGYRLIRSMFI
jgi:transposase